MLRNKEIAKTKLAEGELKYWNLFVEFGEVLSGKKSREEICKYLDLSVGYCDPEEIKRAKVGEGNG